VVSSADGSQTLRYQEPLEMPSGSEGMGVALAGGPGCGTCQLEFTDANDIGHHHQPKRVRAHIRCHSKQRTRQNSRSLGVDLDEILELEFDQA